MTFKFKKLSKKKWAAIIVAGVLALIFIIYIVGNIFAPVKYLSAYLTIKDKTEKGQMAVNYVDVGFGDCIIVNLPDGKTMVIDGGNGEYNHNLNMLKYLNKNGVKEIDYLICSSVNSEHCGGLTELLSYKNVKQAYIPYCKNTRVTTEYHSFVTMLNKKNIPYSYSGVGMGVQGEEYDYFFTFLSPSDYNNPNSEYADLNSSNTTENINNASAVIWLEYGNQAFVFGSDAGSTALKNITESYELSKEIGQEFCAFGNHSVKLEKCTTVLISGHGSKDCTYAQWYEALSPQRAIISVAKNYSNCPSASALADVSNSCDNIALTSEVGSIKIIVEQNSQ